jgi:hypothetical protein
MHKKEMKEVRSKSPIKRRLSLIGGGVLFAVFGLLMQEQGKFVWTNWFGQNVFAPGITALGGTMMVLGLLPNSWVARFAQVRKQRPINFHQNTTTRAGKD